MIATSSRRRYREKLMLGLLAVAVLAALIPLGSILFEVISKGIAAIHGLAFFRQAPPGDPLSTGGGVANGIIGTLEMVGVASLIFIPLGILGGVYLVEFGSGSVFSRLVRFFSEVMTGIPSIVFGIFVYSLIVLHQHHYSGWAGALALGMIMWPLVVRTSEEMLSRVPVQIREASLALGIPKWKTILRVVLPAAASGLVTGCMLGVARAAGETAPLLFTALGSQFTSFSMSQPMASLPVTIFNGATSAYAPQIARAWGAALTLIALVLLLTLIARFFAARRST